ncbi:hypothetical protein ACFLQI_02280 [Candidatus Undinarchaeota archaeon]
MGNCPRCGKKVQGHFDNYCPQCEDINATNRRLDRLERKREPEGWGGTPKQRLIFFTIFLASLLIPAYFIVENMNIMVYGNDDGTPSHLPSRCWERESKDVEFDYSRVVDKYGEVDDAVFKPSNCKQIFFDEDGENRVYIRSTIQCSYANDKCICSYEAWINRYC